MLIRMRVFLQPIIYFWIIAVASVALAQSEEIINFEHINRAEFAIHLDWLGLESADEETLVRAVYEDYIESARDLEQSWLLVLHWSGRWNEEVGPIGGAIEYSDWYERMNLIGDWQQYRQFVGDEIEIFQQRYFDDLRALLPDREATIERLELLRFRTIFFDNRRTIYFRDMPDIVMTTLAIVPDVQNNVEAMAVIGDHERQMHVLLQSFKAAQDRMSADWQAAVQAKDHDLFARMWAEPMLLRMRMRELTKATAANIAPHLAPEDAGALRETVEQAMYPSLISLIGGPSTPSARALSQSTIRHLLRQPGLTAEERARLEGFVARVEEQKQSMRPDLKEKYDALFTRRAIEANARELAAGYIERSPTDAYSMPEMLWAQWAAPLYEGGEGEAAEVAAIAVALGERPAPADFGPPPAEVSDGAIEPLWLPSASTKQIDEALRALGVDDATAHSVREVQHAFRHAFSLESLRTRVAMNSAMEHFERMLGADSQEARGRAREMQRSVEERWIAFRRECEARFVEDVAALLTADQAKRWRTMHAQWHRARMLEYIAERLQACVYDIALLFEEAHIDVDGDAELKELVQMYHLQLDAAIDAAVARYPSLVAARLLIEAREGRDSPEVQAAWDRVMDLGKAVAAVNERSLPLFFEALSDAEGERLREAIDRRRFPGVFQESPVERLRALFSKIDDLPQDSRLQLDAIFAQYGEREQQLRRRLVEAIERWRSPGNAEWIRRRQQELTEAGQHPGLVFEEHPALPIFEEENRFVAQTVRRIRGVFSNEEFERLPPQIRILTFWVE